MSFRGSIVVSIPACHAGDPGSIPGLGVVLLDVLLLIVSLFTIQSTFKTSHKSYGRHSQIGKV